MGSRFSTGDCGRARISNQDPSALLRCFGLESFDASIEVDLIGPHLDYVATQDIKFALDVGKLLLNASKAICQFTDSRGEIHQKPSQFEYLGQSAFPDRFGIQPALFGLDLEYSEALIEVIEPCAESIEPCVESIKPGVECVESREHAFLKAAAVRSVLCDLVAHTFLLCGDYEG